MDSSTKKNKLDEDAKTYCDILAKCSLPEVAKWKDEDLERAFRWSSYFKQVHSRCMHRVSLMEKFDKRFREIGRQGGWRFAGEPVNCGFLGTSLHYLTKALLENPALPFSLREKVFHRYAESEGREASETLLKHLNELDSSRELLEKLQSIHIKVKEHVACHQGSTPQPGLVSVDAMCLLEDIHWLISLQHEPGHVTSKEAVVHKKLSSLVHETKGGLDVVLHSLLVSPGDKSGGTEKIKLEDDKRVILDWFLQQLNDETGVSFGSKLNSFQQTILRECSPDLLAKVASVYSSFLREYIKLLMAKAEEIEQSWMHDLIKHNSQDQAPKSTPMETGGSTDLVKEGSDWKLLLDHFIKLTQSGGQTKVVCVSLLKAKIQPPIAEKFHLPPMVGTIWNRILHAVLIDSK